MHDSHSEQGGSSTDDHALDRRRFQQRVAAAFGGLVAGATLGCGGDKNGGTGSAAVGAGSPSASGSAAGSGSPAGASVAGAEKHACRGLNACAGQGYDGKNACAGQGTCAIVAHHSCGGQNECKNLGGCGAAAGANDCKGKGGCAVPLDHSWEAARKNFETRMAAANKKIGAAPAKKP